MPVDLSGVCPELSRMSTAMHKECNIILHPPVFLAIPISGHMGKKLPKLLYSNGKLAIQSVGRSAIKGLRVNYRSSVSLAVEE